MTESQHGGSASTRYLIGIDLGTTNCSLSYVDTQAVGDDGKLAAWTPQVLAVPQWDGEGSMGEGALLPSFYYLPAKAEWKRGQMRLPLHADEATPDFALGRYARLEASRKPGRVVHSAKSWLCHGGVDREERILPWHSDEIVGDERRSPVEVSAAYLEHLRLAFDAFVAKGDPAARAALQEIIITVPASFDEAAQRLTLNAAALAGFDPGRVRLLEEPQAAFYRWLALAKSAATRRGESKAAAAKNSGGVVSTLDELIAAAAENSADAAASSGGERAATVLIADIGGGTTDFSLFRVAPAGDGACHIERLEVSEHLLLGGDNIDLSVAHLLESKLVGAGRKLSSRSWAQLVFESRRLKEKALDELEGAGASEGRGDGELHVAIAGEGAGLFASAMTAQIAADEVVQLIREGFLPPCARDATPRKQRTGLSQLGLPYAADSAITHHLASFLAGRAVDAVMFTGGSLAPRFMRESLLALMTEWQGFRPLELRNDEMDLAVSLGAADYGVALRRRQGIIGGGYARSLYVEVARQGGGHALVCIVPKGYDGQVPLDITGLGLKLRTDRPARFALWSSIRRDGDRPGDVVALVPGEFHPLPPLVTRLDLVGSRKGESLLAVDLAAALSETGMLELACLAQDAAHAGRRWQLDFNVRERAKSGEMSERATDAGLEADQVRQAPPSAPSAKAMEAAAARIEGLFGKKRGSGPDDGNPRKLPRDLEEILGSPRDAWDMPLLRALWPLLAPGMTRRNRSLGHEVSWLHLAGYTLRPGYGYELDEWRIAELWRCYELGLSFPKERQAEEQWWIMWRRVAGGLARDQQEVLFDRLFPSVRKDEAATGEVYMLLGSLERIETGRKLRLGQQLVQQLAEGSRQHVDQKIWALARIASRVPLYGGPAAILRPKAVAEWLAALRGLDPSKAPYQRLSLFYTQAGRIVGDREADVPDAMRRDLLKLLERAGAPDDFIRPLRELVPFDQAARARLFGESLPAGLILE